MKIVLHAPEDLELKSFDEPGMDIEARDPEAHYGATQMFAASLALCTGSVLVAYADQAGAHVTDLAIRVKWHYADKPFRIGAIDMAIRWPSLPETRLDAARRAASHCTLHHTLEQIPELTTTIGR